MILSAYPDSTLFITNENILGATIVDKTDFVEKYVGHSSVKTKKFLENAKGQVLILQCPLIRDKYDLMGIEAFISLLDFFSCSHSVKLYLKIELNELWSYHENSMSEFQRLNLPKLTLFNEYMLKLRSEFISVCPSTG